MSGEIIGEYFDVFEISKNKFFINKIITILSNDIKVDSLKIKYKGILNETIGTMIYTYSWFFFVLN